MIPSNSTGFKEEHLFHFIPTFEEATVIDVAAKEGVLDATNHTAVIFKKNTQPKPLGEEVGGNPNIFENRLNMKNNGGSGVKAPGQKGGWKINKTLKGPGNKFKTSENLRVSCAESMKMAVDLLTSELDGYVDNDLSLEEGERLDNSIHDRHGSKVDPIIAKLGMEKSHRVEAIGFSGGICLDKQNRKVLWRDLSLSIPIRLNYMILDFKVLPWHCGNIFERLDQALGNEAWMKSFPNCLMVEALDFSECVRDNWRFDGDMTRMLADFIDKLRNWNKCNSSNLGLVETVVSGPQM
ncbi:hypothetical protein Golob_006593 [Gossypium lobatum]|uniref:DUF4283 domain-containing protein n=1 Tax=Gossypium lobatum TaxID=34289 RepID=A0A7J8MWN5_9ROSI|nr:hypothetical protein [Gossypium lobatum]